MLVVTTLFSVLSCISFVLVLISFPWHLRSPYNSGIYLYMVWTSLGCLNLFINSVIWRDSMSNVAPVWCDISTKFMTIVNVALPVSSCCISRHMYHLATRCTPKCKTDERRGILLDLFIGLGVPAIYALLHIIVQRFRFNIFESYGCMPSVYNTPLAYVIVQVPILAFALVSTIYCFMSLIRFRRITVEDLPAGLCPNPSWYFRLLCLAATEIILSVSAGIMKIVISSRGQVTPWVSWEDTHAIVEFPFQVWGADLGHQLKLEEARWAIVARAVVLFALFAFSNESRGCCWHAYRAFADRLKKRSRDGTGLPDFGCKTTCSLPSFNTENNLNRTVTASSATIWRNSSIILDVTSSQSQEIGTNVHSSTCTNSTIHQDNSFAPLWTSAVTLESVYSTRVEPGHGYSLSDNNKIPLTSVSDARNGAVLPMQWKDLPLLPHEREVSEDDIILPLSATTSESMYSTNTAETEFTSVPSGPLDVYSHSNARTIYDPVL